MASLEHPQRPVASVGRLLAMSRPVLKDSGACSGTPEHPERPVASVGRLLACLQGLRGLFLGPRGLCRPSLGLS